MADTPIPKQEGLSKEDMKKMEVVTQKFKTVPDSTLKVQKSLADQEEKLKNLFWKFLVDDFKRKMDIDSKDEYAINDCIDKLIDDLVPGIASIIKAQAWKVTTTVATVDDFSKSGWTGVTTGTGTGTAEAKDVTTE